MCVYTYAYICLPMFFSLLTMNALRIPDPHASVQHWVQQGFALANGCENWVPGCPIQYIFFNN